jgi:pimeloyl-ACP methyl ester carboxylesterase
MEDATRYAKNGDVHIAYQVHGVGPPDLVYISGLLSHVEFAWEEPSYARFLRRLSSIARLILIDMRGVGLSDRAQEIPLLEEQMDDITAVLQTVGSEHAAIFGVSQGGPAAMLYAATYPARTTGLILYGSYASAYADDGYPWGRSPQWTNEYLNQADQRWGRGFHLPQMAPSLVEDRAFQSWWGRFERYVSAPGNAVAFIRSHSQDDVRSVLPTISVPTLVLQRRDDVYRDSGHGRFLAEHIPGAKYVELAGHDHLPYVGDQDAILSEVEAFITGNRAAPTPERVLGTVLFTDIVGSTARLAEVGDRRWSELLQLHHSVVRQQIERFRGQEVNTTGDGFFATFDGPARAIRCALATRDALRSLGLAVRAGLHTGEMEVTETGVTGIAVHIGARVAAVAAPSEVLVTRTVKDLVTGSGYQFADRGTHVLKGVPDSWQLFTLVDE